MRIWLLFVLCGISATVFGQPRLELVHADLSRGQKSGEGDVTVLEGNVFIRQDTVEIYCDRAFYYRSDGRVVLQGRVRLVRGAEVLTAQKVTYYEKRKLAIAEKNVFLRRPGQTLTTEYLEYYYETDHAFARGNLKLTDADTRALVTAGQGEYNPGEERSRVEKNAHFVQVDSTGRDTLHIYARVMEYYFAPVRRAIARDSVVIVRGELVAFCDSALYDIEAERVFLEKNPRARQRNNELTGTQMELDIAGMELRQIWIRGTAVALSVQDSLKNKVNRLSGREMMVFLKQREIQQLRAYDNAESRYYLENQPGGQGVNEASADTIKVYFVDREVRRIAVTGGSQGVYRPGN